MTYRQLRPACATAGVDMYPDPDDELGAALAVAVCARCPLRQPCADRALTEREQWGVWGGLTETARQSMVRHGRLPAHILRMPSRAQRRRENVAYLAGQGLTAAAIAAQLGETLDRINRDLQFLRGDDRADKRSERAAARTAKAATIDSQIDAMLAAGMSINRICAVLHVGRPKVYARRGFDATQLQGAAA